MKGARLAVAESVGAATAAPAGSGLSRYPARTASAVLGHDPTRLQPSPAVTRPPWPTGKVPPASGLDHVRGQGWPSTGSSQAGSQGVAAAETVGR
jgi:hypothetical protein